MARASREQSLYTALDFAMVRAPLLPVEAYLALRSVEDQFALLKDPRVRRAVAVGSLSLLNALDRFEQSALTAKDADRLRAKLLRYQIRMSTRPTPYGLFAGCAIAPFGNRTDLGIRSTFGSSHTRPDMAWLMDLVTVAESDPAIRRRLRLVRNPLIRSDGDRLSLSEQMPTGKGGSRQPVSVRATSVVQLALDLAKRAIDYGTLAARLGQASPSATPEKVDRLLTELWKQTFLLTDLRPPLTTDSPGRYVLDRLSGIPEAGALVEKLDAFLKAAAVWDRLPHDESVSGFRALLRETGCPEDGSKEAPVQVDMALSVEGQLNTRIAEEAARAAELLLRLSPSPRGLSSLAAYRNAFISRYGHEREVPLLELLDPDRGLGSVSAHGHAYVGPDQSVAAQRSHTLLALACAALHKRQRVLTLDDSTLRKLETWQSLPEAAPVSLDINVLVGARSAEAIDAGDFTVVVGPNLGAWAAGRNFGRFAHLHPPEQGRELLRRAASTEEATHLRDHLWVEVVYLPSHVRSANVAVRPPVRSHEVVFGASPGVSESGFVPLEELVVGVANGRFYVRWPAAENRRLHFVSGHMLNHHGAPPAAQFLLEVIYDAIVPFTSFDWGPAEGFPFLPRVQAGRVVLRPAEWKISSEVVDPTRIESFNAWRLEWDVPRYVSLSFGDNRLVLDLDRRDHVQQVMTELAKLTDGRSLLIQEVVPALDEAWLTGEEGHYYSELIVPLLLRPFSMEDRRESAPMMAEAGAEAPHEHHERPRRDSSITPSRRQYPPGSEWLFVKLYCPTHQQDDLIGDSLSAFASNATASGLADSWFFIRYADPDAHIRLRFHGVPDRLSGHLFGQVCRWASGMIDAGTSTRFVFDTYDRELERFGGPEGLSESENLFHADSCAAAVLVRVLKSKQWSDEDDRMILMALTIDDLLRAVGFDEAQCLRWYKAQTAAGGRDSGPEYRTLKDGLRGALGDLPRWLAAKPFGALVASALEQRRRDLAGVSTRLRQLADSGLLDRSLDVLSASYTHLHLNRLGGASSEQTLISLLRRARESLTKAPLR
jgi:thiopeptide-type bacteriocin biosynthesis protein